MSHSDNFKKNRQKVISALPSESIAIFFAAIPKIRSGDTEFSFCQDKNFYYLTGFEGKNAILMIVKTAEKTKETLFVPQISEKQAHWSGHLPSVEDVKKSTGIENCSPTDEFLSALSATVPRITAAYIDYNLHGLEATLDHREQFVKKFAAHYPHVRIQWLNSIMADLRIMKENWEVERIREACRLTKEGILSILKIATPGMFEYELDAAFDYSLRKQKFAPAFSSIIAGGINATVLHYSTNSMTIAPGDLVLLDLGAEYKHYSADISRTFPIKGTFTSLQKDLYSVVLEANERVIQSVQPGISFQSLTDICRDILAAGLLKLSIIQDKKEIDAYFTHGVSHSLGLDTHDIMPAREISLEPGMVITVEPGLYLKDKQIGIRIEDNVLVTATGHENLSADIPKQVKDIEALMRNV
jgi:Xaa-Pro aminopeptidase